MSFIFAVILLALALGAVVVRKTYYFVPAHELKRKAETHDRVAGQLYRAVAYGSTLRSFLWLFIATTGAGGFVLLCRSAPPLLAFVFVAALLWAAFAWLPASRTSGFGTRLAMYATPPLAWLLGYLHPILFRLSGIIEKRRPSRTHTGVFERDDLLKLVERQQHQPDNRLSTEELEIVRRALSFDDYKVGDVMISRQGIKTVLASDMIGPVFIDELHQSGQEFVLVREFKKGAVIGTLAFQELNLQSKGSVRDAMDPTVYYLHESDSLTEALHAFFVTNHPMFVVVNNFEEYLGIITVQTMLRQLLGHLPGDNFDQYADLSAVAARHTAPTGPKK